MADLRDNELSPMDDSSSVSNVTDKKKTKTSDKNVPEGTSNVVRVIANTESDVSNESNQCMESIESMESSERNESNESNESNEMKGDEIPNKNVRSLADPSSEGAARTKKVAKASSRKARKPSSSTPSLPTTLPGAAKHVGLPSSVSAVPPRNRAR
ncbi:uncharacterized protein [Acropora muricata]|uniref:uncharacterized protein n=1 Tax=Acropora muricata TaxID=159855 RepID=UPI0034E47D80